MNLDTKGGHDEGTRLNECTKRGDIENKKMIRDNENEVIYIRKARQNQKQVEREMIHRMNTGEKNI